MSSFENNPEMERLMQLPRAYEAAHSWGRFIVSAAAHEAYGLVPLHEPSSTEPVTAKNELDIVLLSPDEHSVTLPSDRTLPPNVHTQGFVSLPNITTQKGIQIACSFSQDRRGMLEASIKKYAELRKVDPQHLADNYVTKEDRVPIEEYIQQRLNTNLIHAMYPGLIKAAYEGYQQIKRPIQRRLPLANIGSIVKAERVADDVHNIYCSDMFNHRFTAALKN